MKFNQKAERYYGQYTKEIKQNLERGTAIQTELVCYLIPCTSEGGLVRVGDPGGDQ